MSEFNIDRRNRGIAAKQNLNDIIGLAKELNYVCDVCTDYYIGDPDYSDQSQFHPHYLIEFEDGAEWIIDSTTSIRDRVSQTYWKSYNIKRLDSNVTKAFLVYPDGISQQERKAAEAKNRKITTGVEYSTLDGILSQEMLFNEIEQYATRTLSPGQIRDLRGRNFEKRLAFVLSNSINLQKLKTANFLYDGVHYLLFKDVLEVIEPEIEHIDSINATSDSRIIGTLPSGGPPKTDILVEINYTNGTTSLKTISCKRSSSTNVSVAQFPAETYARVLDPNNQELNDLLLEFQTCGNKRDMMPGHADRLTDVLAPYLDALVDFALGGHHGDGNPTTQWANYIVIYDNNMASVRTYTLDYYRNHLLNSGINGAFGTPFGWTYQGQRGTNIQLKTTLL